MCNRLLCWFIMHIACQAAGFCSIEVGVAMRALALLRRNCKGPVVQSIGIVIAVVLAMLMCLEMSLARRRLRPSTRDGMGSSFWKIRPGPSCSIKMYVPQLFGRLCSTFSNKPKSCPCSGHGHPSHLICEGRIGLFYLVCSSAFWVSILPVFRTWLRQVSSMKWRGGQPLRITDSKSNSLCWPRLAALDTALCS